MFSFIKSTPFIAGAIALVVIVIAVKMSITAYGNARFEAGRAHEKLVKLEAQNKALLEYVEQQKNITDAYLPILGKLKTKKPSNAGGEIGIGTVIDYAIDSVPNPYPRSSK